MSGNGCMVAFITFGMLNPKDRAMAIKVETTIGSGIQPTSVMVSSSVAAAAESTRPVINAVADDIPQAPSRLSRKAPAITAAEHALKMSP